jgi:hypothetical protein
MGRGVERNVAAMADDRRGWFGLGIVTAIETHASLGYLLTIELQPSGREIQARLVGRRVLVPVAVDDEVMVAFPDADPNRAVAWPSELPSSADPLPSSWTNEGVQVVDPAGLEVRTAEGATVQAVVTEDILSKIQGMATEVVALAAALSSLGITVSTTNATQLAAMTPTQFRTAALQSE